MMDIQEHRSHLHARVAAVVVLAGIAWLGILMVTAPGAQGSNHSGTISGTVTGSDGLPVAGAWVEAEARTGDGWTSGYTDDDGRYELQGLDDGVNHSVTFWADGDRIYLPQYYDGASSPDTATPVEVPAVGINAQLEASVSLSALGGGLSAAFMGRGCRR